MGYYEIASTIQRIREEKGKSIPEIAEKLELTPVQYERIEAGIYSIDYSILKKIAHVLNFNIEDILNKIEYKSLLSLSQRNISKSEHKESVQTIDNILSVFKAQERLYVRMKDLPS